MLDLLRLMLWSFVFSFDVMELPHRPATRSQL